MTPTVRFRVGATVVEVGEGGLIGRASTAQLRLMEADISEAHAMVSLRGGDLRILALRGRVRINDVPVAEATLQAGQRVVLGAGTLLMVEDVSTVNLPPTPPTVGGAARPVRVRIGAVVTIQEGEDPPLTLGGNQAEFLRLLADAPEPMHWTQVARYFWAERDQPRWRERFDAMVREVRGKLRGHRIRADLVWSWDGVYRLHVGPADRVEREG